MKKLINLYQEYNFPTSHENAREVSRSKGDANEKL